MNIEALADSLASHQINGEPLGQILQHMLSTPEDPRYWPANEVVKPVQKARFERIVDNALSALNDLANGEAITPKILKDLQPLPSLIKRLELAEQQMAESKPNAIFEATDADERRDMQNLHGALEQMRPRNATATPSASEAIRLANANSERQMAAAARSRKAVQEEIPAAVEKYTQLAAAIDKQLSGTALPTSPPAKHTEEAPDAGYSLKTNHWQNREVDASPSTHSGRGGR